MTKQELEKINMICKFLNDLASQFTQKTKVQNKEVAISICEAIEDLKETLLKAAEKEIKVEVPEVKIPEINVPEVKIPEIRIPEIKVPQVKMPDRISFAEAADITGVLLKIIDEIKKKNLNIDLRVVEDGLWNLQAKLDKKIEELKKAIPKMPKINLPMEKGRIKVILPEDQVIRTPLGEKVSKAVRGIFMGGEPTNPNVYVRKADGTQINPATEETLSDIKYLPGLSILRHDSIELNYTGANLTKVKYFQGVIKIAELVLEYDINDNLIKVSKV